MEKNEPFHHFAYYILSCPALSRFLFFSEVSKEGMQLSALLFPRSDDFRERERVSCIPQILVTQICEIDINMFKCCCPYHACLNLLFFGETQLCTHTFSSSLPLTCLFHLPAVAAYCVSTLHLSQYTLCS